MSPASGRVIPMTLRANTFPGVLLAIGYGLMTLAGFFGLAVAPVTSAAHVLGYSLASIAWDLALIFGGLIGLFSRFTSAPRTEIIAVESLAAVLDIWAVFILLSPLNDQSAILLVSISFLMYGWAAGTRRFLARQTEILDGGDRRQEE